MTNESAIIEEAAVKIKTIEKGTMVTHIVLSEMLGAKYRTNKYYGRVDKLRKWLEEKEAIFLKTEQKAGYTIAVPGDEIDLCEDKCITGIKTIFRGIRSMNCINLAAMPEEKKSRTLSKVNKYGNLAGMLKAGSADRTAIG